MKNFIIILSVFLMTNLVVNGQEIIKTKSIEQIEVKSPTLRHPEAKNGMPGKDSSITIRICSPSRAEMLARPQPLYVFNIGKYQYKIDGKEMLINNKLSTISPQNIQSISIAKDKESISAYGDEGKNGVIIITFKDNKESNNFGKSLKSFRFNNRQTRN